MSVKYDPILGKLRAKDGNGGGGSEFDPTGVYPELTAGGLIGKASDAIKDENKSWIFRTTAGGESVSDGYADIASYKGNVVNGQPFFASALRAVGFNCFNPLHVLSDMTINSDGQLVAASGQKVAYIHVLQGVDGSGNNNGYVVRSEDHTITRVGYSASIPATAGDTCTILTAATHGNSTSYLPSAIGYLWVAIDDASDLMAHIAWSGYRDEDDYEAYADNQVTLPMCHAWGMAKAGTIYDEVDALSLKKYTRVDRVMLNSLTWVEHQNSIIDPDTQEETFTYSYTSNEIASLIKASTTNFSHYGLNNACVLSVGADGTLTISSGTVRMTPATHFACYLYYEMANPVEEALSDELQIYISDFGTEELLDTIVPPTAISMYYLTNLTDFIRSQYLNRNQNAYIVEKISFINSPTTIYVSERSLTIREIHCYGGNTPKLNGNNIAVGTVISADTIYTLSLTMTDNSAMIILKTQANN